MSTPARSCDNGTSANNGPVADETGKESVPGNAMSASRPPPVIYAGRHARLPPGTHTQCPSRKPPAFLGLLTPPTPEGPPPWITEGLPTSVPYAATLQPYLDHLQLPVDTYNPHQELCCSTLVRLKSVKNKNM